MQLTTWQSLALAAATLAGTSSAQATQWEHDAALLYYGESDDRVQAGSVKYQGKRENDEGDKLTVTAGVDALTGASPLGVAPSYQAQTMTSPSGKTITIPAGTLPLDDSFKDLRVSGGVQWDKGINEHWRHNSGVSLSKEQDYLHTGVNSTVSRYLNNKNTTLSAGLALGYDQVQPIEGKPVPLSLAGSNREGDDTKKTGELMLGVTQVLSKRAIAQLNYSYSQVSGYLNDPYKYISITTPAGVVSGNRYESRPDTRKGHTFYGALKYKAGDKTTLTSSLRFHQDDWGTDSFTAEQAIRFALSNERSIEPSVRFYHQKAADFYKSQLLTTDALPQYASADYRLATFDAYTVGATYRWQGSKDKEWRITGEYYKQKPKATELTAGQAGLSANPGFEAVILSLGVKF
ncbi:DUF3570 domain-containing protein [Thiofilum flexile]|uniref:DUF3570 domain-containing protein n=1 Tax=Thiofilum flexile TaxID=125627 RepID=UPI000374972C|nr:DUF3570 domain-containing protein [Thiofilum flexile]